MSGSSGSKAKIMEVHKKLHHNKMFSSFAERAASWAGTPLAFVLALAFVCIWLVAGSFLKYSSAWELTIATVPAIVTFLLVFIIQSSQNRCMMAIQLKLNELIRATEGAHTVMVNLEKLTEEELFVMCEQYEMLAQQARKKLKKGETDQGVQDIPIPPAVHSALNDAKPV